MLFRTFNISIFKNKILKIYRFQGSVLSFHYLNSDEF
jgi:hypothetical protein